MNAPILTLFLPPCTRVSTVQHLHQTFSRAPASAAEEKRNLAQNAQVRRSVGMWLFILEKPNTKQKNILLAWFNADMTQINVPDLVPHAFHLHGPH